MIVFQPILINLFCYDYYQKLIEAGFSPIDINIKLRVEGRHTEHSWADNLSECLKFISMDW